MIVSITDICILFTELIDFLYFHFFCGKTISSRRLLFMIHYFDVCFYTHTELHSFFCWVFRTSGTLHVNRLTNYMVQLILTVLPGLAAALAVFIVRSVFSVVLDLLWNHNLARNFCATCSTNAAHSHDSHNNSQFSPPNYIAKMTEFVWFPNKMYAVDVNLIYLYKEKPTKTT